MPLSFVIYPHKLHIIDWFYSAKLNPGLTYAPHFIHLKGPPASHSANGIASYSWKKSAIGYTITPSGIGHDFITVGLEGTTIIVDLTYHAVAIPSSIEIKGIAAEGGIYP